MVSGCSLLLSFYCIIPGPNALLVLNAALTQRKLFAFVNVLGVSCGFFFTFISANGISLLLSKTPMAFEGLKWVGVLYLIWLGFEKPFSCGTACSRGRAFLS
ncbi:LysE family transporter [Vibrio chagasii]|nr:LysE family transporter [Vibrio chagasii]